MIWRHCGVIQSQFTEDWLVITRLSYKSFKISLININHLDVFCLSTQMNNSLSLYLLNHP